jgi:hypothetical protein
MARLILALLLTTGAFAVAACGGDDAQDTAGAGVQEAQEQLSAEAQALLERAQTLAADVTDVGRRVAAGELDTGAAEQELSGLSERGQELVREAEALPEDDPGRERVVDLARQAERSMASLTEQLRAADPPSRDAVEQELEPLQREAESAARELQDRVGEDTRSQIEQQLDRIR